jgi:hypothetical protein
MSTPTHKPSFWNGWDFKTIMTYVLIIGGFVVTQVRSDERMKSTVEYLNKGQQEIKESVRTIWDVVGAIKERVTKAEGINSAQQKDIDKHDKKLYP